MVVTLLVKVGLPRNGPESKLSSAIAIEERRCYRYADSRNCGTFALEATDYATPPCKLYRCYHVRDFGGEV
jgi:hypothetical protein